MVRDNMTSPTAEQQESSSAQVSPESAGASPGLDNDTCKEPGPNDVLCGRGGSINSHPGNERFRTLVEKRKRVYLTARFKREKRLIASSIVSEIRGLKPPGRFLQQDKKTGLWKDIGDEKARDKTSQALRENAPTIRAEIETEINEQRAELRKEEDDVHAYRHMPPHPQTSYYQGGWGPSYPSYYGYSHHAPPPPPPHHVHLHPGYYPAPPLPAEGHWGYYPGAPPPSHGHPHRHPAPPPPKSAFEQTAEYISSGAESFKRWSEETFSLSGTASVSGGSRGSRGSRGSGHDDRSFTGSRSLSMDDMHDTGDSLGSMSSRPLSYVHHDDSKKRRMVKFRSDTKRHARRRLGPTARMFSSSHSVSSGNSLLDHHGVCEETDIEPHRLDDEQNASLMDQVSTHILSSIGSWDAGSILCGIDTTEKPPPAFPAVHHQRGYYHHRHNDHHLQEPPEEDMAVEWEGQEVQLIDQNAQDHEGSVASEERMPPPARQAQDQPSSYGSLAFSSLGSCHSWLPEQMGAAASYFSGRSDEGMDMEGSVGALENHSAASGVMIGDQHSVNGSIGGGSLTRVFEHEVVPDSHLSNMDPQQRGLVSMPSWERTMRARSPLSIESDDEDISLISKESSKISADIHFGPQPAPQGGGGMVWERKE